MKKKVEFDVHYIYRDDYIDILGSYENFIDAYNCACKKWNSLTDTEKKSRIIEICKKETLYNEDNEPIESNIITEDYEQFSVGYGYFMLDGKEYHIFDIDEYFSENDYSIKDLSSIDYTSYALGKDQYEKYIYTIYKAVGKDGRNYEVAIAHNLLDGILSSDLDKYTSEMDQEVQLAKVYREYISKE